MDAEDGVELLSLVQGTNEPSDVDTESELINNAIIATTDHGRGRSLAEKLRSTVIQKFKGDTENSKRDNSLKKELNLFSSIAYVVGVIIGSGVFITPRTILCLTGSFGLSLVMWAIGGIIAMAGGLCYIELGLLIRKSGGEYNYLKEAYSFKKKLKSLGSLLGFLYVWSSLFIIRPSSLAIITLTCGRYLIRPFYIGCDDISESAVKLLALVILLILALINGYSLNLASKLMSVLLVTKILAILFVVVLGVYFVIRRRTFPESFTNPFDVQLPGHESSVSMITLSLYGVVWAYDGWNVMGNAVEETKNVRRNLPLSILIGVPIVTVSYLLVNVSFFAVLDFEHMLSAKAVALPFGMAIIGTAGLVVFPLLVAMSTFGTANGSLFSGTRITFVAAREGHLPDFLSGLHVTAKTPVPAIIVQVSLAMLFVVIGSIDLLIDGYSALNLAMIATVVAGILILRVTHREEPRLFKAWFIIPIAVSMSCVCVFLVLAPFFATSATIGPLLALGLMLLGVPVYILLAMEHPRRLRPKIMDKISGHVAVLVNNALNTQSTRGTSTGTKYH